MKWVAGLVVASSCLWAADSAQDLAAIDKVIASLNSAQNTRDDAQIWSEMSRPMIVVRSVQFLSSGAARVEAARVQYGSIAMRSAPVVILLERTRTGWRITSLREAPDPLPPPIATQPAGFLPQ